MIVLKKEPNKNLTLTDVENTLEALQEAVGGYIETVTLASDAVAICDEEARLKGKPYCCNISNIDFYGTILVAGVKGEDFASLSGKAGAVVREWIEVKR